MRPIPLPPGWGEAALFEAGEAPWADAGATRSYDHGGATLAWRPPAGMRAACDMERLDKDLGSLPTLLGVGGRDLIDRWVLAEASAKVHDVPMVLWLKRHGLERDRSLPHQRVSAAGRTMAFCRSAA